MRILVINPNASTVMSDVIRKQLAAVARTDVDCEVVNPRGAPPAIESAQDAAQSIPPMLEVVRSAEASGVDAIVIACFSDPGLDAAREATTLPVVGIQQAAMHLAAQLGDRFSVLTTGERGVPGSRQAATRLGLETRLASSRVLGISVLETVGDRDHVVDLLIRNGRRAIEDDGAEVLVLGCAGLGDLASRVQQALGVPVIDPNAAALKLAEALGDLGLAQSKVGLYATPAREDGLVAAAGR